MVKIVLTNFLPKEEKVNSPKMMERVDPESQDEDDDLFITKKVAVFKQRDKKVIGKIKMNLKQNTNSEVCISHNSI